MRKLILGRDPTIKGNLRDLDSIRGRVHKDILHSFENPVMFSNRSYSTTNLSYGEPLITIEMSITHSEVYTADAACYNNDETFTLALKHLPVFSYVTQLEKAIHAIAIDLLKSSGKAWPKPIITALGHVFSRVKGQAIIEINYPKEDEVYNTEKLNKEVNLYEQLLSCVFNNAINTLGKPKYEQIRKLHIK